MHQASLITMGNCLKQEKQRKERGIERHKRGTRHRSAHRKQNIWASGQARKEHETLTTVNEYEEP